jgi:hypothetical protein
MTALRHESVRQAPVGPLESVSGSKTCTAADCSHSTALSECKLLLSTGEPFHSLGSEECVLCSSMNIDVLTHTNKWAASCVTLTHDQTVVRV